jgi:Metallo-peptidase family M12B Reprolysin-like
MSISFWRLIVFAAALIPSLSHSQPTVRVLTVVTNEALQFLGSTSSTSLATNEINKTNLALINSKINLRVEHAGVLLLSMPMPLTVDDSIKLAKKDLTILGARDAQNADVVLVIHRTAALDGVALKIGATRAEDAFAAIHAVQTQGALYGYSHELGHLFGGTHQDIGGVPNPYTGDTPGGQGYYFRHNLYSLNLALPGNNLAPYCKHTLMAYPPRNVLKGVDCTNYPSAHVLVFSNPNVCELWYTVSSPSTLIPLCFGDNSHNNATVVGQKGPVLTSFRNTKLRGRTLAERVQSILLTLGLLDPDPSCSPGC